MNNTKICTFDRFTKEQVKIINKKIKENIFQKENPSDAAGELTIAAQTLTVSGTTTIKDYGQGSLSSNTQITSTVGSEIPTAQMNMA